ncbi:unnamed protein product [Bursaphelenchus okinawaensis]|uniref:Uncharacterized protein n=1 Tax=Bursaphelenchus okinawaensis TaxID=465554 RepID=A0A811LH81_9BILA|nr:unnamed protein product [Bursaphelenchus okinawaensis]CAG9122318.1 unnamed protein product [Bursaphelenchus okinawaensis]
MNRTLILFLFVFCFQFNYAVIEYLKVVPIAPGTFYLVWKMSSDVNIHKENAFFKIKSQIQQGDEARAITELLPKVADVCKEHVGRQGVTICSYNSTSHAFGVKQEFMVDYYEKKTNLLGSKTETATSYFYPPTLRVVSNSHDCIKLLLRVETFGNLPKKVKVELKSNVKNAEWSSDNTYLPILKPQNLYSYQYCNSGSTLLFLNKTESYLFRYQAIYETTFSFMNKNYTIIKDFTEESENLWSHVQYKNEPRIVFPVVTTRTNSGWFLNFTLPNITKKDDSEEAYRIEYKKDRYSRPYNWISVPKKTLNSITITNNQVSINMTEVVAKKKLLPETEFRIFFRQRTTNGWVWSQPSYSFKHSDLPKISGLKPENIVQRQITIFHRLAIVVLLVLIGISAGYIIKSLNANRLFKNLGFGYKKLDSDQEMSFV